ncbi:hypothetical protein CS0771_49560 [Catellatospora sp. IY07-71]|uniref:winged helix-turn-helix domain-containing protein n=1 Tax=Catellatospora sp. IY07-71 TaxID=2728827 RepID=UPI001BB5F30B|nr:winged helix-turn-helix domain-containing protein [Catellatospora sp. IY07-71]BCJ75412.1 hypothetical protein CS0771_49560 [Catellatospora sp. IY07-71]
MTEDDETTPDRLDPADELYTLLIAVAPSPAERIRLAERLDGIAPLLLVADLGELRRLIPGPHQPVAAGSASGADDALVLDAVRSKARCQGREVELTRLELDLLTCLTTEPVRVWSYAELHEAVWHEEGRERRADVQSLVKRLRRKLHELGTGTTIDAVRGVGLRLSDRRQPRVGRS